MAFNFLTNGRVAKQFSGLLAPKPDDGQDNTLRPGNNLLDQPTPMMDLYKKSLEEMPDENTYKHPLMQKILAGIAGFSTMNPTTAYKTSKSIQDEPYESDLSRWKNKIGQTGELAGLEEKTNASKSKNLLDWIKSQDEHSNYTSLAEYRKRQGANLDDQIANRGREHFTNKNTGQETEYDKYGKPIYTVNVDETPDQKDARELSNYKKKGDYTFINDSKLIGKRAEANEAEHKINTQFDITNKLPAEESSENRKAAYRAELERDNAKFKSELDKMTETQKDAAYTQATKETITENPEFSQFFDQNGNLDKSKYEKNPDVYNAMLTEVRNKLNYKYGKKPAGNALAPRGTSTPKSTDPDQESKDSLKGQKDGYYELSNGTAWNIKNGVPVKVTK